MEVLFRPESSIRAHPSTEPSVRLKDISVVSSVQAPDMSSAKLAASMASARIGPEVSTVRVLPAQSERYMSKQSE